MHQKNTKRARVPRWLLAALAACPLVAAKVGAEAEQPTIVIVTSRDDGPYQGVVEGVRETIFRSSRLTEVPVHSLQSQREQAVDALLEARSRGSAPIVAVGSVASEAALEAPGRAPVVACMVVDADQVQADPNATAVMLEFSLETQLRWIRRFVPGSQAIGVLYNPAENQKRIDEAQRVASRLGVRLVAEPVHRPQDLPAALDRLARDSDLLFALTDQMVLSPQTAQAILLFSFRNRLPFSGLSSSWVKAGALYSLERDYPDLGAQCAELALQLLDGRKPAQLPPVQPRKIIYDINLKTANHLKLRLPPELIEGAAQVYR